VIQWLEKGATGVGGEPAVNIRDGVVSINKAGIGMIGSPSHVRVGLEPNGGSTYVHIQAADGHDAAVDRKASTHGTAVMVQHNMVNGRYPLQRTFNGKAVAEVPQQA
jgi:hypothetical protein